jgi:hypothetical protein
MNPKDLHRSAMEHLDRAIEARRDVRLEAYRESLIQALDQESAAADLVANDLQLEPTRSVLHRSAASIAMEAGEYEKAEQLICRALIGKAPADIGEELRDLLEQVHFQRHLKLRGVTLESDEFQMSMSGNEVGFGITRTQLFLDRVDSIQKLLLRTVERKSNRPFRSRGPAAKTMQENVAVFLSVPRAASFAVSFRLGKGQQTFFEGLSIAERAVDEVLECFELFNADASEELKKRIEDNAYYANFVALAQSIAPDGRDVKFVGLTAERGGKKREVRLTRPPTELSIPLVRTDLAIDNANAVEQTFEGRLAFADAIKAESNMIKVVRKNGTALTILVPEGIDDIVRPMWDTDVVVTVTRDKKNKLKLVRIMRADVSSAHS